MYPSIPKKPITLIKHNVAWCQLTEAYKLYDQIQKKFVFLSRPIEDFWIRHTEEGKKILYSASGKRMIPFEAERIHHYLKHFAIQKDGLWGYYNRNGKQVIPHIFDVVENPMEQSGIVFKCDEHISYVKKAADQKWYILDYRLMELYERERAPIPYLEGIFMYVKGNLIKRYF
ncbi:hypothetical protein COE51_03020 [Bacillus pseudomycoides]|nr:hypothetical protein COE51_03020 [Bacillus pseudomycoides]